MSDEKEENAKLRAEVERLRYAPRSTPTSYLIERARQEQQVAYEKDRDAAARASLVQRDAYKARLDRALALLRDVEWSDNETGGDRCHICGKRREHLHRTDCELAALLEEKT